MQEQRSDQAWLPSLQIVFVSSLAVWAFCVSGCGSGGLPAHDKDSLVTRIGKGLVESGASPQLEACLTEDLDDVLTEKDAEAVYEDLSSNPDASERSLNSVSLLSRHVKARLKKQAEKCKTELVLSGTFTPAELDHMFKRMGMRAYRWQPDFFTR